MSTDPIRPRATLPPTESAQENQREEGKDWSLTLEIFEQAYGSREAGATAFAQYMQGGTLPEAVRQYLQRLVKKAEELPLETPLLARHRLRSC